METLPKFIVNDGDRPSFEERGVPRAIRKSEIGPRAFGERLGVQLESLPDALAERARLWNRIVNAWNRDFLGMDTSRRILPLNRFRLSRETMPIGSSATEEQRGEPKPGIRDRVLGDGDGLISSLRSLGLSTTDPRSIVLVKGHTSDATLAHEIIHSMDGVRIVKRSDHEWHMAGILGYHDADANSLGYLYESMTELRTREVLSPQHLERFSIEPTSGELPYKEGVFMLDALLSRLAETCGPDARKDIYRGCLKNNMAELRRFKEVFGVAGMRVLSKMNEAGYSVHSIEYLLTNVFGVDGRAYAERVAAYERGEEVALLSSGISIRAAESREESPADYVLLAQENKLVLFIPKGDMQALERNAIINAIIAIYGGALAPDSFVFKEQRSTFAVELPPEITEEMAEKIPAAVRTLVHGGEKIS